MTAHKSGDPTTLNRLYGRSQGRKLRQAQQDLVDNLLPKISVPEDGAVTSQALFGQDAPLHFEIGFGGGEHLAARADLLPDHAFIGCEPFLNGVVGALQHVRDQQLFNVRLHMGDALEVLARIPDNALSFVYLLHPDPWPKARHAKRRMMNDGPVNMIAAKLKSGGEFRFGTDHPVYLRHALMVMRNHTDQFDWLTEGPESWQKRPGGWSETRYEAKARQQGHEVWYFRYRRTEA
ncbi:tRNA (guanine(46)-N(7))-methyltransferase TrmB [Altericroceibacterium endophyticum]|uniref:tRNA (guanine-N(7)-)-methyltransferase n=1 Tax=Altericroceibacterium endophyticum TaxID=1808508 RepID=A0A6I4T4Y1_9SPHN|nr:tRNA (guanine(46)-N(7))-methyltransferase TrmB [Altericroceibacterium endophyticum]MXO65459.1 tRNA (guanosine(46)-N7)-methyltransferase TrmB [Altericroceibacterium endophyticum]